MLIKLIFLIFVSLSLSYTESAKILSIFPFPGPSQYISAQPYLKALVARGHEVTVISNFPQKEKLPNFRDITVKYGGYDAFINGTVNGDTSQEMEWYANFFRNATLLVLDSPEVQQLIKSGEKFDLLIIEAMLTEALYALGPHFNAHLIGFSTYGTDLYIDKMVGNTSPLSYIPPTTSKFTDRMNFWERLQSFVEAAFQYYYVTFIHFEDQRKIYHQYFPDLNYELDDIRKNFSLLLLNNHFSLSFPRPYVPNMIEVGGLYLEHKPKPLPKDIADFINSAEHGVIYFSMGSNVKSKYFSKEKREAVIKVLGSLKQKVLWKFEEPNLPGKPDNVFISKWFPQPDILAHPNVKLFITHAGLLSTIEAIYHGKPVIGVPVFFDQFMNIERAKQMGFGLSVPYRELNEENLKTAILEMLDNKSYSEAVQVISKRYHDQPIKPLDKAIFWTEYVLRHNGAPHMRVAARDMTFIQFYSLDTIGFILLIVIVVLILLFVLLKFVLNFVYRRLVGKNKKKIA